MANRVIMITKNYLFKKGIYMFEELGGFFGWLLIGAFGSTLLNYLVKFINKKWGKTISGSSFGKKTMKLLMTVFVRNHRFFGFLTAVLLLAHFTIQFSRYGINLTGSLAATLIISQVGLGIYAMRAHKLRKGAWFVAHRLIAVLIILGISLHLLAPYALNSLLPQPATIAVQSTEIDSQSTEAENPATETDSQLTRFTKDDLATYNGKNGNPAYVAYKNVVYDVTNVKKWVNGEHNGNRAGNDLTQALSGSPHGETVLKVLIAKL